eukprot:869938-Pelagomonas_calceolata.AAC.3
MSPSKPPERTVSEFGAPAAGHLQRTFRAPLQQRTCWSARSGTSVFDKATLWYGEEAAHRLGHTGTCRQARNK